MQTLSIDNPSDADQRIDRFCKKYLPNIALGGIYKLLRTGKIKVNKKKKDQTYKLQLWDEVTFWLTDDEIFELRSSKHQWNEGKNIENISVNLLDILYEDDYLMIINKPSGINVHAWDHKTTESNLIDQVHDYLRGKYDSLTFRPALVHRIDRDTSGCLMIAKRKDVLESLLSSLQNHEIQKIYHAIVFWEPSQKQGVIRERLLRIENAKNEAKVRIDPSGQIATTHYVVIATKNLPMTWENISLIQCRLETGRTHQIRVHLSGSLLCPIIGDKLYGNKSINAFCSRNIGISRQMLHAYSLEFQHPISREKISIRAPYPEDFRKLL